MGYFNAQRLDLQMVASNRSVYQIKFFQNAAWEVGSNTDKLCVIFLKKRYKISGIPAKKPKILKKFIEAHFSRSKIILLLLYDVLWRQSVRKKSSAKVQLINDTHMEELTCFTTFSTKLHWI